MREIRCYLRAVHISVAITGDGVPLGLAAVKFWTRKKFKGTAALKRKINPTRVSIEEKESVRWLDNLSQRFYAGGRRPAGDRLRLLFLQRETTDA